MLILPSFVVENKGWFGTKPPCQDVTCGAGGARGGAQGPVGANVYDKPQNPIQNSHYSGCAAAVLYLSLLSENEEEDYDETCNGDYRETGPDLKSTEVNGGFPSCFPHLWISPPALPAAPSPLHQKMLLPLLYAVHWDGFADNNHNNNRELITIGNRIHIPSDECSTGVPGLTCHQVCSVTRADCRVRSLHTHTYSGYSNTKVAKKHTHFIIAICHQTTNQQHI